MPWFTWDVRGQRWGVRPPFCGFQGQNSGHQALCTLTRWVVSALKGLLKAITRTNLCDPTCLHSSPLPHELLVSKVCIIPTHSLSVLMHILQNSCLLYLTSFLIYLSPGPGNPSSIPVVTKITYRGISRPPSTHQLRCSNQCKDHDTEEAKHCPCPYWAQPKMEG